MNYRDFIIESILNEDLYDSYDITMKNYSEGGIPDLSGPSSGENAWDSPKSRKQKIYYEYYMVILDDDVDNAKKSVIFVKCPPTMDGNLKIEKLQDYFRNELGYRKMSYSETIISPRIVRSINDFMTTYGKVAELTGANVDDLEITPKKKEPLIEVPKKTIVQSPEKDIVSSQMEQIKKQAYDLAKEKYVTLISNGVDEVNAQKAAKDAYMAFVMKFKKEREGLMKNVPSKKVDNPLLHGNVRELINQTKLANAKEKALERYVELIKLGKSKEYAKVQANKLYQKLKG